jgi:Flp pilus assembly protein TadG
MMFQRRSDAYCSEPAQLARQRKSSVSVMFAAAALPIIGLIGLAVDFGIWNESNSTLSVAANVAALTAVKIAANAQLAGDPNAIAEGQTAGQQWFLAEIGSPAAIGVTGTTLAGNGASVAVTGGATLTATVAYSGTVPSIFGKIFDRLGAYPINGQAVATVASAPFLNIDILLDNSGSMLIGASNADIVQLQALTPCSVAEIGQNAPGAFYNWENPLVAGSNLAGQSYNAYQTAGYDGDINPPIATAYPPLTYTTFPATGASYGPSCKGVLPPFKDGNYPAAGPPCAFACHFDNKPGSPPAGSGNDFYAIARSTIGSNNPITLRFDLVKAATNAVIAAMGQDNIPEINNLQVGVFAFDTGLHQVYPDGTCSINCEAGNNWALAESDVGAPPSVKNGPDTGIQPSVAGNGNGNSDFHDTMTALSQTLTPSGDGTKATTPRKVLFLISDGYVDNTVGGARTQGPINVADCNIFKAMGFTIYVVYTPYTPVMNGYYVSTVKPNITPYQTGPLAQALQTCASDPTNDYVAASDLSGLNTALQKFLKAALTEPARFTM